MNGVKSEYQGNPISFSNENGVMVNATNMAKPFGKRAVDWIKTQSAKDFLNAYTVVKNFNTADLVQVRQGGNEQGTYL